VFSALGSRAERLPGPVRGALSLESRAGDNGGLPPTQSRPVAWWIDGYGTAARVLREGPTPLLDPVPGMADREALHVAAVIPPFARGSGGHSTLFNLLRQLEAFGHTCSLWAFDPLGHDHRGGATLRGDLLEWFGDLKAPVFSGFDEWYGADVALATSWHTVYPVLALDQCRARAYLVQDHEPEFHPTSVESRWAEQSYGQGLYCIAASQWLLDLIHERYGADGTTFRLGVDHAIYHPRPVPRRRDTVVFYARASTPRRAVPLGILALGELHRRRPDTRIVLFGDTDQPFTPFPYDHAGLATPAQLSWLYSEATVGMCLSLTNYSLVPQEMLACGLPCVDLAGGSAESELGADAVEVADFDPVALADAMERLLLDETRWRERSEAGIAAMAGHRWDAAGRELEAGLREALRARERAFSR
jgi:glycosyltransferase involved in cell wall biosynthesis